MIQMSCRIATVSTQALWDLGRRTVHLEDDQYSDEERIKARWYDAFEMASIWTNVRATVAMMERVTIHKDETKYCTRGLEQQTKEGSDLC
jgi:hypothetical protein